MSNVHTNDEVLASPILLLEINLLGRFQLKIDGAAVDEKRWGRRSAKSLVKLLAMKPFHALHREQIMDLLWAEETPETALNNLNKAIHSARRAFEPELTKGNASRFILTGENQITLASPGSLRVDLDEFERLANYAIKNSDLEAGQKALELYRGDLLTEDIYEDWIYTRRESMRILFRKTATKTATLYAAENNHPASIEILKKLAGDDPSDEHVQRKLMRAFAETGSKYQALKQFEMCRAALDALGIEPEPETFLLEQKIKHGEIASVQNGHKPAPPQQTAPTQILAPRIEQLTFQHGLVRTPRFLPNGKTIVFSAVWDGEAAELFALPLETGEISRLGTKNAEVFSVSSDGEIAAALHPKFEGYFNRAGLAKITSADDAAQEIFSAIHWADWHPSKKTGSSLPDEHFLAVVRERDRKNYLEFPAGNVLYECSGWLSHPRFSADGTKIAFIEHPLHYDDRGFIVLLDLSVAGKVGKRILTDDMSSIQGLAWSNDEIWFTGASDGNVRLIKAVNLKGEKRRIYRGLGRMTLHDVSESGAVLVTDDTMNIRTVVCRADGTERNLSWHDWTMARDLTDDGEILLFEEAGVSGGSELTSYIRNTDGTAVRKLKDCSAISFSPDNNYALLRYLVPEHRMFLFPLGEGEIKQIENDPENPLTYEVYVDFFPDGKRIIFTAIGSDGRQVYIQNIDDGGKPARFTTDNGVTMGSLHALSPDGEYVVLTDSEKRLALYRTSDRSHSLLNLEKDFWMIRWADDGENIFVWKREGLPVTIYKYNTANGTKEKWLTLMPKDPLASQMISVKMTPDGKTCAYSFIHESSNLYLLEGLS